MVRNVTKFNHGRVIIARLEHGCDLINEIQLVAAKHNVNVGIFTAIGALTNARLAFYDQVGHQYKSRVLEQPIELVSCIGNISAKEGKPFVHLHAALALEDMSVIGGHLLEGKIFAAELHLQELTGDALNREHDIQTGLYLFDGAQMNE